MVAQIIDGKSIADNLKTHLKNRLQVICATGKKRPGLAVILVGNDPASLIYVRNKRQACEAVGIHSVYHPLPDTISQPALIELITTLNADPEIHGILLQLPLPEHIDAQTVLEHIHPHKDVDGFHPYNLGRLAQRKPALRPATPHGIMLLLEHIQQAYKGKHAVIVGASNVVGRPMALELLTAGATVTVCHRFTHDLKAFTTQADILVAAVGKPHLIKASDIKAGATIIDVGINRLPDGSITGDVDFHAAKEVAGWITPVPGGVGPMTVAALLYNTLIAAGFISS